jgi:diadenosine tetraphosphatase ApaH/serine/threonine PP2A family protein phosphatase
VFLCHGTPASDTTYWLHHVLPDGTFAPSPVARAAALAGEVAQPRLLCGHTHLAAAIRLPDGRLIVSPGSVGCPAYEDDHPVPHRVEAGTPHAAYAILDRKGTTWSVSLRRLPYDTGRARQAASSRPDWVSALETGWLPPL